MRQPRLSQSSNLINQILLKRRHASCMICTYSSRKGDFVSFTSLNMRQLFSTGIPCTPCHCAELLNLFNDSSVTSARFKTCIERAKDLVPRGFGLEILLGTAPRAVRVSHTVSTVRYFYSGDFIELRSYPYSFNCTSSPSAVRRYKATQKSSPPGMTESCIFSCSAAAGDGLSLLFSPG